ncbi:MAG: hypothetical protein MZV49_10650 [Rhodopseudomonas palustris]|nr:hypothetical protein [Rhodopseudomonas palustris]
MPSLLAADGVPAVTAAASPARHRRYPGSVRTSSRRPAACSARSFDLLGIALDGRRRPRPWLRHARVAGRRVPAAPRLRRRRRAVRSPSTTTRSCASRATACTRSRSGPVHAGIIEPGHFRFSIVGEKVLRLEQRLGYVHKGIERALRPSCRSLDGPPPRRPRVAATRTVAFAWAYCHGARAACRRARAAARARGCARCCSSASASPTTSATSARSATTPASPSALAQFSRLQGRLAARQRASCSATAT